MKFNEWLNSSPNAIRMHDSALACFEINYADNYIMFRWAVGEYGRYINDELTEIDDTMQKNDLLLVDQVFYKPKIIDLLLSSGLCAVDMEVADNDYADGVFKVFARDGAERYFAIDFIFESYYTRAYRKVSTKDYYEDDNEFDIKYDIAKFSLQDFEQGKGYMNVDGFDIKE